MASCLYTGAQGRQPPARLIPSRMHEVVVHLEAAGEALPHHESEDHHQVVDHHDTLEVAVDSGDVPAPPAEGEGLGRSSRKPPEGRTVTARPSEASWPL